MGNAIQIGARFNAHLAFVVFLALLLRITGATWGLPDDPGWAGGPFHPDEGVAFKQGGELYSNPDSVTFGWGGAFFFRIAFLARLLAGSLAESFSRSEFATTLLLMRALCVTLGTATVAIVGRLAAGAFGPTVGLVAAALLACFPNAVLSSHFARPDTIQMFLCTVALACAFRFSQSGSQRYLFAGGLVAGLGLATSAWGLVAFAPLGVAWIVRRMEGPVPWPTCLPIMGAAGYVLGSFETFLYWDAVRAAFQRTTQMHDTGAFQFPTALLSTVSFYGFGTLATVSAWIGMVMIAARRKRTDWVILGYFLFACFILSRMGSGMMRHVLILAPVFAMAASLALVTFARWLPVRFLKSNVRIALVTGAVVLFTLHLSLSYVLPMQFRDDPRVEVGRWFAQNARPGSLVGVTQSFYGDDTYIPRFPRNHDLRIAPLQLRRNVDASRYLDFPLDYIATTDYAIDRAAGPTAPEFFRELQESPRYRLAHVVSLGKPFFRLADRFDPKAPGDLMYLRSSHRVYEREGAVPISDARF